MFKLRYLINDFAQAISKLHMLELESAKKKAMLKARSRLNGGPTGMVPSLPCP